MSDQDLRDGLRELNERVGRIELHLGLAPEQPRPATPPAPLPPPVATPAAPPTVPPPAPPTPARLIHPLPSHLGKLAPAQTPVVPANARTRPSLEVLIGERWMAWVGAIVVVVAVGFFVKLAYDLGWWGRLAPLAKCLMGAGFGAALIIAGELALRKISRPAAASLFGAGLGTLYLTAYASFRYFELVSQSGAFWLLLLVAALGFALTVRGRLASIGVLALLGGYLSPILLSEQVTFAAALPLYVTALLFVALALSATMPQPFRVLRYVGLTLHVIVASLWLHQEGEAHWLIAMVFLTLWWALVTTEAAWAAFRGQSPRGNAVVSLLFTFWFATGGCGVLAAAQPGAHDWLGVFVGIVAVISVALALPFGPGLEALKKRPGHAVELLAASLWGQGGILVAAAIGLQFRSEGESFGQTIGWLAMTLVCVEMGARLPSRGVTAFGLLVGLLALGRAWFVDPSLPYLRTVAWSYGDVRINYWAILALGAIGVTQFATWRLWWRGARVETILRRALSVLGALQWMALCIVCCDALALTTGWLVAVAALLVAAPLLPRRGYVPLAAVVLTITAAKWLAVDAAAERLVSTWSASATTPMLNWQMAVAAAIALCGYGLHRRGLPHRSTDDDAPLAPTPFRAELALIGTLLFLMVALGFEVDRAIGRFEAARPPETTLVWGPDQVRALWWTLLAAGGALGIWLWGRAAQYWRLHATGFTLLLGALAMWLSLDTLVWRIERDPALCAVVLNVQFGIGVAVAALLVVATAITHRAPGPAPWRLSLVALVQMAAGLLWITGVWLGSLELDRYFAPESARVNNAAMARQTALSVYWGLYAIVTVGVGFWQRCAWLRYAGLVLLALTLGKVLWIDLAHVEYIYRVLSLLCVGLLFIGTSIAYARFAPRLLRQADASDPAKPAAP